MKHRVGLVLLLLVAGAMVNVAVAWGLSAFAPIRLLISHRGVISLSPADPPIWQNSVHSQFGAVLVDAEAWRYPRTQILVYENGIPVVKDSGPVRVILNHPLPAWSATHEPPSEADFLRSRSIREIAYGWPMLTIYTRQDSFQSRSGSLPVHPIWLGAVVNSACYAALLAIGAVLWQAQRRRIKRGLCPACAYPVGDNPVCTECGKPVKPKEMAA